MAFVSWVEVDAPRLGFGLNKSPIFESGLFGVAEATGLAEAGAVAFLRARCAVSEADALSAAVGEAEVSGAADSVGLAFLRMRCGEDEGAAQLAVAGEAAVCSAGVGLTFLWLGALLCG